MFEVARSRNVLLAQFLQRFGFLEYYLIVSALLIGNSFSSFLLIEQILDTLQHPHSLHLTAGTCMEHAWNMHGTWNMEHAWNIRRTWLMDHGICIMEYAWNMHVWNMGTCMEHGSWNAYACNMEHACMEQPFKWDSLSLAIDALMCLLGKLYGVWLLVDRECVEVILHCIVLTAILQPTLPQANTCVGAGQGEGPGREERREINYDNKSTPTNA